LTTRIAARRRIALPVRAPPLAQGVDGARVLRFPGRIVAHKHAHPCLYREAMIDFLQLRHSPFGLLVVAGPGVGRGEVDERGSILRCASNCLAALFDGLRVKAANPELNTRVGADREDLNETPFRSPRSRHASTEKLPIRQGASIHLRSLSA
jgi:hypothetical protein